MAKMCRMSVWVTLAGVGATSLGFFLWSGPPAVVSAAEEKKEAGPPNDDPPTLAELVSIEELQAEVNTAIADNDTSLANEQEYKTRSKLVPLNANTLAILSHAVSQHEHKEKVPWHNNARHIRDAALKLAAAESYAEAQPIHEQIKGLLSGGPADGQPPDLAWNEIAPLADVMPIVNRRYFFLRRLMSRIDRSPDLAVEAAQHAAVEALLFRMVREYHSAVEDDADFPVWQDFTDQLRDGLTELKTTIQNKQFDNAQKVFKSCVNICNDCHKKFRPDIEM